MKSSVDPSGSNPADNNEQFTVDRIGNFYLTSKYSYFYLNHIFLDLLQTYRWWGLAVLIPQLTGEVSIPMGKT